MSDEHQQRAAAALDEIAPVALGAAGAPRVNTAILARALAIADDAARSDVECYCQQIDRGVYHPLDPNGEPVAKLAQGDQDTAEKVLYLVERGLAHVSADDEGREYVVLLLDRFARAEP